ncbi:stage II sporulation protein P [Effusibacillus lacus]|uniref:Stage II sporulation protein P n=1 Tax=Effusibacillus lacus TaxID=1348429 RepID=A0A292YQA4_9BACL|nr:stage II sporulation protein P [Effusibacillus lacus]TCS68767.1 stage II sporulation protein P [Effusibacillus lacus]GAX90685.1 stage II sporulation protein P [Effusibacillus lacus]
MNRQLRHRQFRTMMVNMGTRKMQLTVITMSLMLAVLVVLLSAVAVQLMASRSGNSFSARMLHSVSHQSLNSIMGSEIPLYASTAPARPGKNTEPRSGVVSMLFYLLTDINVEHPETMLGGSIAAMAVADFEPLTDFKEPPGPDQLPETPDRAVPQPSEPKEKEPVQTDGKPLVYIYHTHNRESFLPEMPGVTEPNKAYHKDRNIELVGERLLRSLKDKNISAIQTKEEYWYKGNVKNEYDLSRKTAQEVLAQNSSISMIFDIHRDSLPRDKTTAKIFGKEAARVSFIVGGSNPNYGKNEEFAKKLHNKLQKMYPGLSRGAFTKRSEDYDTKYNQDLHPNSIIIEIGGPENTLEEAYYTADLLSHVVAELIREDLKAKKQ